MDHDGRNTAALQADTVLAAKIIVGLPELERDFRLAEGPLSDRLMAGIKASMERAAPEPWEVAETDWSVLLRLPTFKPTKGLGQGDMWVLVNEISTDTVDHCWIGCAVGSGGRTQLGLELCFRPGLAVAAAAVTREKPRAEALAKIGFLRDESGARLFLPMAIDRLRLAKGYSENDLTEALGPVRKAVEAIVAAKAELDALIDAIRTTAKGK